MSSKTTTTRVLSINLAPSDSTNQILYLDPNVIEQVDTCIEEGYPSFLSMVEGSGANKGKARYNGLDENSSTAYLVFYETDNNKFVYDCLDVSRVKESSLVKDSAESPYLANMAEVFLSESSATGLIEICSQSVRGGSMFYATKMLHKGLIARPTIISNTSVKSYPIEERSASQATMALRSAKLYGSLKVLATYPQFCRLDETESLWEAGVDSDSAQLNAARVDAKIQKLEAKKQNWLEEFTSHKAALERTIKRAEATVEKAKEAKVNAETELAYYSSSKGASLFEQEFLNAIQEKIDSASEESVGLYEDFEAFTQSKQAANRKLAKKIKALQSAGAV